MTALVRYQLADLMRSQRWVAPLLVFAGFLGLVYASDAGPAVPAYGITAGCLLPVAAWLTRQQLSVEEDAARHVSAAAAGGLVRVQAALLVASLVAQLPLVLLAVGWSALANADHVHQLDVVAGGLAIHLVFALSGVGLGAIAARPLVQPAGAAALTIACVFVVSLIAHWSPVFQSVRALQHNDVQHFRAHLLPWMAALVLIAAGCAAVSLWAASRE